MNVIGSGTTAMFVLGVLIGIIGLVGMGINYPVYKKLLEKGKQKYAFEIMEFAKKIFLEILEKKDFAYITVKEICAAAGVNRSTFYLHYETLDDLLSESISHINERFRLP